jgi:hypothetical protein
MSDEPQQHNCNHKNCSILLNRHPTLCPFLGPRNELVPFPTGVRHREVWPEIPHPRLMVKMRDRRHIQGQYSQSVLASKYLHQHLPQVVYAVVGMNAD